MARQDMGAAAPLLLLALLALVAFGQRPAAAWRPPPPYDSGMFASPPPAAELQSPSPPPPPPSPSPPPPACPSPLPVGGEACTLACGCSYYGTYYACNATSLMCDTSCFPASATVTVLEDGAPSEAAISQLLVGDMVLVALNNGTAAFSAVVNIPHSEHNGMYSFIRLQTKSAALTLSPEHYAYVAPALGARFEHRVATPGHDVQVGNVVWRAAPDGPDLVQETVLAKEVLQAQGLVNVFTNEGSIIVDGIVASNYIDARLFDNTGTEVVMHNAVATFRLLARLAPRFVQWLHTRGLNQPIVLRMGREVSKVAARAKTGPWVTRCLWRTIYWVITELPARLEAMLPPPAIVPWSSPDHAPAQPHECAWSPSVAANSTSMAVSMPALVQSSGRVARGVLGGLASR